MFKLQMDIRKYLQLYAHFVLLICTYEFSWIGLNACESIATELVGKQ